MPLNRFLHDFYFLLLTVFFASIMINFRVLSSICCISLPFISIFIYRIDEGRWWNPQYLSLFIVACLLYLLIELAGLMHTHHPYRGLKQFQLALELLVLPVICCYNTYLPKIFNRAMKWYCWLLFGACLFLLGRAGWLFSQTGNTDVFFYHPLVYIYSDHAIRFSIIVLVGLLFLINQFVRREFVIRKRLSVFLSFFFTCFLFLLSSKLVISCYVIYLIYQFLFTRHIFREAKFKWMSAGIMLALVATVIVFPNPVRSRFMEEARIHVGSLSEKTFGPVYHFTGVSFRLLQWRFTYEILNEQKAWWFGVSPGDAQSLLNAKYRETRMYLGSPTSATTGYLNFNTHNQFLQSWLESGLFGFLIFALMCAGLIRLAVTRKSAALGILVILLIANSFTDTMLETQYSIVIFVLFPLLFFKGLPADKQTSHILS